MDTSTRVALTRTVLDCGHAIVNGQPYADELLHGLARHIGADSATFTDARLGLGTAEMVAVDTPALAPWEQEAWPRLLGQHGYFRHLLSTRDLTARRVSDVFPTRELVRTTVYHVLLRPRDARYMAALPLQVTSERYVMASLWRWSADFSTADERALQEIQHVLVAALAYRSSVERAVAGGRPPPHSPDPGQLRRLWGLGSGVILTAREEEVLGQVAQGLTNEQVAHRLGIAPATVRKHLESIFPKVGVSSRAAAAAWWEHTRSP